MSKWPSKKLKYVDIDLYKQRVWLTDSREVWAKCCESMGDESSANMKQYDGAVMSWIDDKTGEIVRLLGVFNPKLHILVHECTHAAIDICTDAGIKVSGEQQEPFCYLLENIYKQSAKKLGL